MDKKSKTEKLKTMFGKIKIEYLIVAALMVVALIIFCSVLPSNKEKTSESIDNYVDRLEDKLEKTLSKVDGAGQVEVIVSVESGMKTILATEKQNDSGIIVESPVLVNGKTVGLCENYPEITGVIIVSKGAKNLSVKVALLNAASCYLSVPQSKIEILAMK